MDLTKKIMDFNKQITDLNKQMVNLNKQFTNFNNNINNINNLNINNSNTNKIIINDFVYKNYELDNDIIKKHLDLNTILSDFNLFIILYFNKINKKNYSIKFEKKTFKYLLNNEWHSDHNCEYIMSIIIKTLKNKYLSINKFENYNNNIDKFIENQNYINKFNEKKYKTSFITKLKKLLNN